MLVMGIKGQLIYPIELLEVIYSPELRSVAVMEAKKWLQEKKSGLDSNSDIGYASPSLNLVTLLQLPKDNGSPVDVAKSYMRALPPWASPSIDLTKPPTPSGIQLFKEETPHLYDSTSSSKDEIQRVRSRATEEMLRTPPSKIDWSTFAIDNKNDVNSLAVESIGISLGDQSSVAVPQIKKVMLLLSTQDDNREITTSGLRDESLDDMNRKASNTSVCCLGLTALALPPVSCCAGHVTWGLVRTMNSTLQDGNHLVVKEKVPLLVVDQCNVICAFTLFSSQYKGHCSLLDSLLVTLPPRLPNLE
ncbi:hypothetical protein RJT34_27018 [Clitoria ternatea]|uniref:Uncharacterized protein n=1 Tax=Clitoria ternatea TaxID=43366 RepID=A0AAN9I8C3_CLITE